jgi:hypothetical protein
MCARYERTQVRTASRAVDSLKELFRQATTKLAARRLRSHSQNDKDYAALKRAISSGKVKAVIEERK